jgi:hypothetical protein
MRNGDVESIWRLQQIHCVRSARSACWKRCARSAGVLKPRSCYRTLQFNLMPSNPRRLATQQAKRLPGASITPAEPLALAILLQTYEPCATNNRRPGASSQKFTAAMPVYAESYDMYGPPLYCKRSCPGATPTQAKTGSEWATRDESGRNHSILFRALVDSFMYSLPGSATVLPIRTSMIPTPRGGRREAWSSARSLLERRRPPARFRSR